MRWQAAPTTRTRATVLVAVLTLCVTACGRTLGLNELTFERDAGAPEAQPGTAGGSSEPAASCSRHAECVEANFGEASLCRGSRCIALKNTEAVGGGTPGECRVVVGAQSLESGIEPFLIGALTPISVVSPESSATILNYRLALEEISVGGAYRIDGQSRAPIIVACNSETTAASLDRSFDHLVETLGVPAVIGAISDAEQLQRSFERVVFQQRKSVLFLSPLSAPPLGSNDPDELLWHLLPSVSELAPVYVPLVRRVEDHVSPPPSSGPRPPIRLALVVATDFLELARLGEILDRELVFNGRAASENGPDHYRRFGVSSTYTSPDADVSAQVVELREFRPHVIVSAAGPEFVAPIMRLLEEDWPTSEQQRPFYVLSPYQLEQREALNATIRQGDIPGRRLERRIAGVGHAGALDPNTYDRYLARLKGKFPTGSNLERTENFYDAAYFIAYAAAVGARTGTSSGADLVSGMHRLLHGIRVDVGPEHMTGALQFLRDDPSRTIALHGALGPPDFSAEGVRHGTGSVWCIQEISRYQYRFAFDVLRYDLETGALAPGMSTCFDGF